jgi:serine/threonine protein kinase
LTADQIGPYRIMQRLGAGGMGEVFLAEDLRLGRKVALKSLSASGSQPADVRRRVLREARAVARLNHPNIAAVYDVVESGEHAHIVMEYVSGETLGQRIARGPLAVAAVIELGVQITEALIEAHAVGIVHRDLKPTNIALDAGGKAKILDFGLAHGAALDLSGSTGPMNVDPESAEKSVVVGTPHYIPPEYLVGHPMDRRGDLYSLGVTLFEMLTGQRPYHGSTPDVLAMSILRAPLPHVRDFRPEVPPGLDAVVARAMARKPSDRYSSADEMRDALRQVDPQATGTPTREIGRPLLRWGSPRTWIAAGAALCAIFAAGFGLHRWQASVLDPSAPQVVAVLPLKSDDRNPHDDALGAGVADVLASALSKVAGVTVLPRAATLAEKDDSPAPVDIARRV